jgi:hypothetical protein
MAANWLRRWDTRISIDLCTKESVSRSGQRVWASLTFEGLSAISRYLQRYSKARHGSSNSSTICGERRRLELHNVNAISPSKFGLADMQSPRPRAMLTRIYNATLHVPPSYLRASYQVIHLISSALHKLCLPRRLEPFPCSILWQTEFPDPRVGCPLDFEVTTALTDDSDVTAKVFR